MTALIITPHCRIDGCAEMPPNSEEYCQRHEVGIRLSRREAGWLMYALGLATGGACGRQENELLRLTATVAEQLPEAAMTWRPRYERMRNAVLKAWPAGLPTSSLEAIVAAVAEEMERPLFEPGLITFAEETTLEPSPRMVAIEIMAQLTRFVVRKQMSSADAAKLCFELTDAFLAEERKRQEARP